MLKESWPACLDICRCIDLAFNINVNETVTSCAPYFDAWLNCLSDHARVSMQQRWHKSSV